MSMKAKMHLEAVIGTTYGGVKAFFRCSYDQKIEEDKSFCKATPSGMLELQIDNPAAITQLTLGKSYYLELTEVPAE